MLDRSAYMRCGDTGFQCIHQRQLDLQSGEYVAARSVSG
jgi:hypothetical protein